MILAAKAGQHLQSQPPPRGRAAAQRWYVPPHLQEERRSARGYHSHHVCHRRDECEEKIERSSSLAHDLWQADRQELARSKQHTGRQGALQNLASVHVVCSKARKKGRRMWGCRKEREGKEEEGEKEKLTKKKEGW